MTRRERFSLTTIRLNETIDIEKINLAILFLYHLIVPNLQPRPSDLVCIDLNTFFDGVLDKKNIARLIPHGLVELITLVFLFDQDGFNFRSINIASDAAGNVKQIFYDGAQFGFSSVLKKNGLVNPSSRDSVGSFIHYKKMFFCFPIYTDQLFDERSKAVLSRHYATILKILMMPLYVIYMFFSMKMTHESALFFATHLAYENSLMIEELSHSKEFMAWYFSAPHEITTECDVARNSKSVFNNTDPGFEMEQPAKIFLRFAYGFLSDQFNGMIETALSYKNQFQREGFDFYYLLVFMKACLIKSLDVNEDVFLSWQEKRIVFYKTLDYILHVYRNFSTDDAELKRQFSWFFDQIKKMLPSTWIYSYVEKPEFEMIFDFEIDKGESPIKNFIDWLVSFSDGVLETLPVISCHFNRIYQAYFVAKENASKQMVQSAVSFMSSFLSATRFSEALKSEDHFTPAYFQSIESQIKNAKTPKMLTLGFVSLFSNQNVEVNAVHKNFLKALVGEYQRYVIAKHILTSSNYQFAFSFEKYKNTLFLSSYQVTELIDQFLEKIRRSVSLSSAGEDALVINMSQNPSL